MSAPAISDAAGAAARARSADGRGGAFARTAVAIAAIAVVIAVALALTQSPARPHPAPAASNPHGLVQGATMQQARCSDWLRATPAEKEFAVRSLAGIAGQPTEYRGARGVTLTRDQTYNLLNNVCSHRIASGFLLYELYNRAAGFQSLPAGDL